MAQLTGIVTKGFRQEALCYVALRKFEKSRRAPLMTTEQFVSLVKSFG
jgi:hypothetical protein